MKTALLGISNLVPDQARNNVSQTQMGIFHLPIIPTGEYYTFMSDFLQPATTKTGKSDSYGSLASAKLYSV